MEVDTAPEEDGAEASADGGLLSGGMLGELAGSIPGIDEAIVRPRLLSCCLTDVTGSKGAATLFSPLPQLTSFPPHTLSQSFGEILKQAWDCLRAAREYNYLLTLPAALPLWLY
jgi:hypothetical protein